MRYQIFSSDKCLLPNIDCIGYSHDPKVTRFGPGSRNVYIIHYVLSGKGFFNGHQVSSGQGFLITPGMLEEYYPDIQEAWEFLWIITDDEKMADLFKYYNADIKTGIFNYKYVNKVKSIADMLILNQNAIYSSFEITEVFLNIFKNQLSEEDSLNIKLNSDIYIEAAINYIKANSAYCVTVTELTDILGISQSYLYRIFKEKFGKSPKQYLNDFKLEQAKILLSKSNITVTQVANSIGFNDVLTFSKFFSSKEHISPHNYRLKYKF